jgi:RNA polymerase sigma factor (sigma-70 family)
MNTAMHMPDLSLAINYYPPASFTVNNKMLKFSEDQLVRGLQQRKEHIFSYLYDNYAPMLNGIIQRSVQNKECAEDLLQEVFVKIWKSIESYDKNKGRLCTWMITLAANHTIDFVRSKNFKARKQTDSRDIADKELACHPFKPERFDGLGIKKNVDRLKPEYIQLINMAYYDGLSQNEISQALGMPLGTVKTKLRSAIGQLRKTVL